MTDPNLIEAINRVTEQIESSAFWIRIWLFVIGVWLYLLQSKIKKD